MMARGSGASFPSASRLLRDYAQSFGKPLKQERLVVRTKTIRPFVCTAPQESGLPWRTSEFPAGLDRWLSLSTITPWHASPRALRARLADPRPHLCPYSRARYVRVICARILAVALRFPAHDPHRCLGSRVAHHDHHAGELAIVALARRLHHQLEQARARRPDREARHAIDDLLARVGAEAELRGRRLREQFPGRRDEYRLRFELAGLALFLLPQREDGPRHADRRVLRRGRRAARERHVDRLEDRQHRDVPGLFLDDDLLAG